MNNAVPDIDVVVSSRIRIARNFEGIPFAPRMDEALAEETIRRTREAVDPADGTYSFYRMALLSEEERTRLVEHHMISYDLLKFLPQAAALIRADGTVTVMINEEDHLRIQGLLPGLQMEKAAELAFQIDETIAQRERYAFDAQWGYLTSCPTNTGTGLRASTMLHLPALNQAGRISGVTQTIAKLGLTVRGLYGEGSDAVGCLYLLSNQVTLGRTEEDIIRSVLAATNELVDNERTMRAQLRLNDPVVWEDKRMRSIGVFKSARILTLTEFMARYSDLRLAIAAGLVDLPLCALDRMMMDAQPGSIAVGAGKQSAFNADQARASRMRALLKDVELS